MASINRRAPLEQKTLRKWDSRVNDVATPWTAYELKHFCRLVQNRPAEPKIMEWFEKAYENGPYKIDPTWTEGREHWLRTRHLRMDGGARIWSPFSDSLIGIIHRVLSSPRPDWRLLGFYDAGTVLRDAVHPVLYLQDADTMEGVAFVEDGSRNILAAWQDNLISGRPMWRRTV